MRMLRKGSLARLLALCLSASTALTAAAADFPFASRAKVPPWPQHITWLNTAGPVELSALRGKFVLLDFWTYCCINCMHILPELHKLEQAWPKNLVVIGVHSAKFSTEQQTPDIVAAIQRYKIEHPVINDARHELWQTFGVDVWPTLVLIDPEGNLVRVTTGEANFEQLDKVLRAAMPYYRQNHLLDETPLRFDARPSAPPATPLRFPGKIAADEASGRLFIADSNHNRLVIARLDGTLLDVIGSGAAGQKDGDFTTAQFNQPQGVALAGNMLYVADTENHEIRRVDLARRQVATVAGTGTRRDQGRDTTTTIRRSDPRRVAISSPWDVLAHGDSLYIAMAGCHQIWRMKLDGSAIIPYAGNGKEDIADGPLLPLHPFEPGYASFAQPSGLASDGVWLYVADSEGSSIRAVPLVSRQPVRTVVGTSMLPTGRLFTFGDVDGPAAVARFQHPLGLAYGDGKIFVADTYNSKIRVVDPKTGTVTTLGGTAHPAKNDISSSFFEPGGLVVAEGKLFVADTNHHLIRTIDIATGQVATLTIAGLKPPEPPALPVKRPRGGAKVPLAIVRPEGGQLRLRVELQLPPGYELDPTAPMEYAIDAPDAADGPIARDNLGKTTRIEKPQTELDINIPIKAGSGRDTLRVSVDYYYCREGVEGVCKVGSAAWIVPIELSASAEQSVVTLRQRAK